MREIIDAPRHQIRFLQTEFRDFGGPTFVIQTKPKTLQIKKVKLVEELFNQARRNALCKKDPALITWLLYEW